MSKGPRIADIDDGGDWKSRAECRPQNGKTNTHHFFDVDKDGEYSHGEDTPNPVSRVMCATCRVQEQCLEYAVRNGEDYGVWANTSRRKRDKIKRQQRAQAS